MSSVLLKFTYTTLDQKEGKQADEMVHFYFTSYGRNHSTDTTAGFSAFSPMLGLS